MKITRRELVQATAAAFVTGAIHPSCVFAAQEKAALNLTLKNFASAKGLLYGSAASYPSLARDNPYASLFAQQCSIMVPENELKWGTLRPGPDVFNFAPADWLLHYAQTNKIHMRGHTLVWHESFPAWLKTSLTPQNAEAELARHIGTVMGHYKGRLHSWDVVNEVLKPEDNVQGGWRKSPWLANIGPDYVELAFRLAAKSDPDVLLVWNENSIEEESESHARKRQALLDHLSRLLAKGVPVGGVGIQSHLISGHEPVAGKGLQNFLADVSKMKLKILITEMDVRDKLLPADAATRDGLIANDYKRYLTNLLANPSVIAVLTWGLADKYTWLKKFDARTDGQVPRPLPFDEQLDPTLSFVAIAEAFRNAPYRRG